MSNKYYTKDQIEAIHKAMKKKAVSGPKHEVKVCNKFNAGGWAWKVTELHSKNGGFYATRFDKFGVQQNAAKGEYFTADEIDQLDWIEPEIKKFTKEQAEAIHAKLKNVTVRLEGQVTINDFATIDAKDLRDWLDSMTE